MTWVRCAEKATIVVARLSTQIPIMIANKGDKALKGSTGGMP